MDIHQQSAQLSSSPHRFPDYCLAISCVLTSYMLSLLPKKPGFTLSIGSGSGLLEALIVQNDEDVSIKGVEVNSTVNRYIAEEDMYIVGGAWDLSSLARHAAAWLFVYPRDPKLVSKYIYAYGGDAADVIIWLGPRVDWAEYEPCFRRSQFFDLSFPENVGLTPYESVVVARKAS